LSTKTACPNCGRGISVKARRCMYCHRPIDQSAPVAVPLVAASPSQQRPPFWPPPSHVAVPSVCAPPPQRQPPLSPSPPGSEARPDRPVAAPVLMYPSAMRELTPVPKAQGTSGAPGSFSGRPWRARHKVVFRALLIVGALVAILAGHAVIASQGDGASSDASSDSPPRGTPAAIPVAPNVIPGAALGAWTITMSNILSDQGLAMGRPDTQSCLATAGGSAATAIANATSVSCVINVNGGANVGYATLIRASECIYRVVVYLPSGYTNKLHNICTNPSALG
jgi:hypothetical protein